MSYQRRQEIESKLPRASEPCMRHVSDLCIRAGITGVTADSYMFIHRAVIDYLLNTAEGKMTALKLLNAELEKATYENQYYPEGYYGVEEKRLDHTQLAEFKGWIYRGTSGPHSKIEVRETPDLVECESCHSRYPNKDCAIDVRVHSGGRERLQKLCNYCRMNSDDGRVRGDSSTKTCLECSFTSCAYHPTKTQRPQPQIANTFVGKVAAAHQSEIRQLEYTPSEPGQFSMI